MAEARAGAASMARRAGLVTIGRKKLVPAVYFFPLIVLLSSLTAQPGNLSWVQPQEGSWRFRSRMFVSVKSMDFMDEYSRL